MIDIKMDGYDGGYRILTSILSIVNARKETNEINKPNHMEKESSISIGWVNKSLVVVKSHSRPKGHSS